MVAFGFAIRHRGVRAQLGVGQRPYMARGSNFRFADNLSSHKVVGGREAIEARGVSLWFLPPYSPDLNPIARAFRALDSLGLMRLWFIGMIVLTFPWHYVGIRGMPRRMAFYNYADPVIAERTGATTVRFFVAKRSSPADELPLTNGVLLRTRLAFPRIFYAGSASFRDPFMGFRVQCTRSSRPRNDGHQSCM